MKRKGLTLVEVILSIAILGIIVMVFIPILSNSFVLTARSGNIRNAYYEAETDANQILSRYYNNVEIEGDFSQETIEKEIKFNSLTIPMEGSLYIIEKDAIHANTSSKLKIFIPTYELVEEDESES